MGRARTLAPLGELRYARLDRLTQSLRGVWNPGTQTPSSYAAGGHKWDLDVLGNWTKLQTDANGSGTFGGPGDTSDDRTYNDVNEVLTRQKTGQGTAPPFAYDDAGNLRTQELGGGGDRVLTHDAWNRLVKVELDPDQTYGNGDDVTVGEYEYNGLSWRTVRGVDTPGSAAGIDQRRVMYYGNRWQMLEERLDDDLDGSDDRLAQQMWGLRYIDDAILRRVMSLGFGGGASFATYYHITDLQYSSVAMLKANATLVERVVYDAYGNARHRWAGDFNDDGLVDSADQTLLNAANGATIGQGAYNADIDLNRDGVIDTTDGGLFSASQSGANVLNPGQVSDPAGIDNIVGYSGYLFNSEVKLYHVRFRWYSPELGRWIERDPLGSVDGMDLYEYVEGDPLGRLDPLGLRTYSLVQALLRNFSLGPEGMWFGRGRLRGGATGIFNRGNFRIGWSWVNDLRGNYFSVHGGTPRTGTHWHRYPNYPVSRWWGGGPTPHGTAPLGGRAVVAIGRLGATGAAAAGGYGLGWLIQEATGLGDAIGDWASQRNAMEQAGQRSTCALLAMAYTHYDEGPGQGSCNADEKKDAIEDAWDRNGCDGDLAES